jgi:uncharacterized protein (TIGR03086 family)
MDTTATSPQPGLVAGDALLSVLADLERLIATVTPDQFSRPTPCAEFDVAGLRQHMLGWVDFFGIALTDPAGAGERPAPQAFTAPADPAAAAAVVATAAARIAVALDAGVGQQPVLFVEATMPGQGVLTMALWEYLVHGHDLALATGQPWQPDQAAAELVLPFAASMLTDEYRGPGKDFAPAVTVAADAPALDRLVAFSGRNPRWPAR